MPTRPSTMRTKVTIGEARFKKRRADVLPDETVVVVVRGVAELILLVERFIS